MIPRFQVCFVSTACTLFSHTPLLVFYLMKSQRLPDCDQMCGRVRSERNAKLYGDIQITIPCVEAEVYFPGCIKVSVRGKHFNGCDIWRLFGQKQAFHQLRYTARHLKFWFQRVAASCRGGSQGVPRRPKLGSGATPHPALCPPRCGLENSPPSQIAVCRVQKKQASKCLWAHRQRTPSIFEEDIQNASAAS